MACHAAFIRSPQWIRKTHTSMMATTPTAQHSTQTANSSSVIARRHPRITTRTANITAAIRPPHMRQSHVMGLCLPPVKQVQALKGTGAADARPYVRITFDQQASPERHSAAEAATLWPAHV